MNKEASTKCKRCGIDYPKEGESVPLCTEIESTIIKGGTIIPHHDFQLPKIDARTVNDKPSVTELPLDSHDAEQSSEGSQLPATNPSNEFVEMQTRDEQQVIDEIKGHMLEEYVYQFTTKDGRLVTGVSYAGIKAFVTKRGAYEIKEVVDLSGNGFYKFRVRIHDMINDLDGIGIKKQPLSNIFGEEVALSTALRNAYRSVIDEAEFKAFALQWLEENKKNA